MGVKVTYMRVKVTYMGVSVTYMGTPWLNTYLCKSIAGGWDDNKCTSRLGVDIKMSTKTYLSLHYKKVTVTVTKSLR